MKIGVLGFLSHQGEDFTEGLMGIFPIFIF